MAKEVSKKQIKESKKNIKDKKSFGKDFKAELKRSCDGQHQLNLLKVH